MISDEERERKIKRQGRKQMGMSNKQRKAPPPKEDRCGAPDAFIPFLALGALLAEGIKHFV